MTLKKSDGTDVTVSELKEIDYIRDSTAPRHVRDEICAFFQGAVCCWCAEHGDAEFSLKNLVGGVNIGWYGTPLQGLFLCHLQVKLAKFEKEGYNEVLAEAYCAAHKATWGDAGWLLKEALHSDRRTFVLTQSDLNRYIWAD